MGTVNQQPSSVTDLNRDQHHTLDPVNIVTEQPSIMPSEAMQSKIKKIYKPVLFLLALCTGIFAIAGAAVLKKPDATAANLLDIKAQAESARKTAQDLFICIIVWSILAIIVGVLAHMGHGSPSTKYEVNEKRDKEKKGVDNDAYDGKKESDVEKGNEKDEKWKNNYVPFDESKEKENE